MDIRILGPVGHCSAALRRVLAIIEEEALRGQVRIRKDVEKDKNSSTGGRFTIAPSFNVPGPFASSRPLSQDGYVSFHFSEQTVTKRAGGGSLITSATGQKPLPEDAASKHDGYVTRPDAVLTISSAQFGNYAERDSAVEIDSAKPAIFSNISDDPEIRTRFWLSVHEHERTAKPDRLVFHHDRFSVANWRVLAENVDLPIEVRDMAIAMTELSAEDANKLGRVGLQLDAIEGRKICRLAKEICTLDWSREKPPLRVAKGRNGRTQLRQTAEFPLGIDAQARVRITTKFCAELAELGVMFTAAVHAPDEHNDERNHHLHVAYYDRPCTFLPEFGKWDFEIREKVPGQHNRYRYPYRQPKIPELGRDPDGGGYRKYRASIIYRWRERFAEMCNEELASAGRSRLYDPRKYSEMGIEREPTEPLGPNAAPLEAAGIPTPTGCRNAEIIWTAELTAAREADSKRRSARQLKLKRALDVANRRPAGRLGETGNP